MKAGKSAVAQEPCIVQKQGLYRDVGEDLYIPVTSNTCIVGIMFSWGVSTAQKLRKFTVQCHRNLFWLPRFLAPSRKIL